jgi:hypothetical protein
MKFLPVRSTRSVALKIPHISLIKNQIIKGSILGKLKDKPRYNDYSENLTYKTVRDQEIQLDS